jgi:hypothetical protein
MGKLPPKVHHPNLLARKKPAKRERVAAEPINLSFSLTSIKT